jgi:hypothetical protein
MTDLGQLKEELVTANHILAHHHVVDSFGHISVRHPGNPNHFLMSRARAPACTVEGDIMEFKLDGTIVGEEVGKPYSERFIHGAILEARPDVMCVVHNHSPNVVPFTVTGRKMRPIMHMCAPIGTDIPNAQWEFVVFESKELNAFAAPRVMGFNTGLILESDDPNELQGVIAHEVGHLAGGHSARSDDLGKAGLKPFLLTMGLGVLAAIAGAPDAAIGLARDEISVVGQFDPDFQTSADRLGFSGLDIGRWADPQTRNVRLGAAIEPNEDGLPVPTDGRPCRNRPSKLNP